MSSSRCSKRPTSCPETARSSRPMSGLSCLITEAFLPCTTSAPFWMWPPVSACPRRGRRNWRTLWMAACPTASVIPRSSSRSRAAAGGAIVQIRDAGHLRRHVRAARLNAGAYLVQEKIDAEMANVAMLYDGGKLVAGDTYQTLAVHPHPFGQSTLRVSREYPRARDALKTMLDALQWNGPCQADFLYDRSRDETFLIDVNPRFWGSVEQSIARGIEFPYYYYRCAMGLGGFAAPSSPPVVATKWLGGDLMRRIVGLTSRSASGGAAQDGLPRRVEGMDDFYGTDPLPFVGWGVSQIVRRVRRLAGGKVSRESLDGIWE